MPNVAFINKCDRPGANPFRVIAQLRYVMSSPAVSAIAVMLHNFIHEHTHSSSTRLSLSFRQKLRQNAAAVQIPLGLQEDMEGVVDIVEEKAIYNTGPFGYVGLKN